jgi:hypothetical protein
MIHKSVTLDVARELIPQLGVEEGLQVQRAVNAASARGKTEIWLPASWVKAKPLKLRFPLPALPQTDG